MTFFSERFPKAVQPLSQTLGELYVGQSPWILESQQLVELISKPVDTASAPRIHQPQLRVFIILCKNVFSPFKMKFGFEFWLSTDSTVKYDHNYR